MVDTSALDVNALGDYPVVITATDASGNSATATRTVTVGYASGTGNSADEAARRAR